MNGSSRRATWGAVALWVVSLAACHTPLAYEPLRLSLERPLDAVDFGRAIDSLRGDYPSLVVDGDGMRAASAWERCEDYGWPARRRLSVFVEDDRKSLGVVVELQHYRLDFGGMPEWSEVQGHARFEREVVDRLRAVLGA